MDENEELIGYVNVVDADGTPVVPSLDNNLGFNQFTIDTGSAADLNLTERISLKSKIPSGFN